MRQLRDANFRPNVSVFFRQWSKAHVWHAHAFYHMRSIKRSIILVKITLLVIIHVVLLHTVEPPEVLYIYQTRTGSNLTSENMTASLNRTSRTLSVSSDEQNTFPVVVWIQLAFTIVLSLVGMGVALYLGCCFRGCSARYSRKEHSHSAGKKKQVRITKDRNSGVAYSANKIDLWLTFTPCLGLVVY